MTLCREHAHKALFLSIIIPFLLLHPNALTSQEYTRQEVTVGVDGQTFGIAGCTPIGSGPACQPGHDRTLSYPAPSFTYTYSLSPSLALEGTVSPTSAFRYANDYGSGNETLAMGGVKTGWRGRRWGFYGEV